MGTAELSWKGGMTFEGLAASGHAVTMDSTADVGGNDSAARPMEVLLFGVMGCTAMDVVSILRKKREPLEDFKILATFERSPEHPKKYTRIHLEYVAYGDVNIKSLERAVELSESTYCGAIATVRGVAEVTNSCRVEAVTPVA
ncbi:MAG: OsmC family protein [Anaerolineae bacterium]|jgi:putative redox protein|nr:OsmC family protein [Anaerolineae bacterium]